MTIRVAFVAWAFVVAGCAGPQPTDLSPTLGQPSDGHAVPSIEATRDITEVALEIAIGDERLEAFLRDHPFEVEDVRVKSGSEVHVFVRFDDPAPTSEWPLDICDITAQNQPMTGVHWRVDLGAETLPAVSPRWGEATCIAY